MRTRGSRRRSRRGVRSSRRWRSSCSRRRPSTARRSSRCSRGTPRRRQIGAARSYSPRPGRLSKSPPSPLRGRIRCERLLHKDELQAGEGLTHGERNHVMSTKYSFGKSVDLEFEPTIERVTQALAKEGFGVLSDIDVSATLKKKLGLD